MRNTCLSLMLLFLGPGCTENAAPVQVGPTSLPAGLVRVEPDAVRLQIGPTTMPTGLVRLEPQAITLTIEIADGAVQLQAAPIPDEPLNRLATLAGIALLAGVAGYWGNRWIRLAIGRMRQMG